MTKMDLKPLILEIPSDNFQIELKIRQINNLVIFTKKCHIIIFTSKFNSGYKIQHNKWYVFGTIKLHKDEVTKFEKYLGLLEWHKFHRQKHNSI